MVGLTAVRTAQANELRGGGRGGGGSKAKMLDHALVPFSTLQIWSVLSKILSDYNM